jgi:hypothetical protein
MGGEEQTAEEATVWVWLKPKQNQKTNDSSEEK